MFKSLMIALALAASGPAESEIKMVQDWGIYENDDGSGCTMLQAFNDRQSGKVSVLHLDFSAKDKDASVGFSNFTATSLQTGETKSLKIVFLGARGSFDDGWDERDFRVYVNDEGARTFLSERLDREFLDDFAKNTVIGFFTGETLVSSFELKGSAEAVRELERCSFRVHGLNIKDPFLR